jgi:hypothetical protein
VLPGVDIVSLQGHKFSGELSRMCLLLRYHTPGDVNEGGGGDALLLGNAMSVVVVGEERMALALGMKNTLSFTQMRPWNCLW